jgi:hypothetical protein
MSAIYTTASAAISEASRNSQPLRPDIESAAVGREIPVRSAKIDSGDYGLHEVAAYLGCPDVCLCGNATER